MRVKKSRERILDMENKLIEFLFELNRITAEFKALSQRLDKLNSDFIEADFDEFFDNIPSVINTKDYE